MGVRNLMMRPRGAARQSFTVPAVSGNYAEERIRIGVAPQGSTGVMDEPLFLAAVVIESLPSGATAELWLPCVPDQTVSAGSRTDELNYTLSGLTAASAVGLTIFDVGVWVGAEIRVKSGGQPGTMVVSAVWA